MGIKLGGFVCDGDGCRKFCDFADADWLKEWYWTKWQDGDRKFYCSKDHIPPCRRGESYTAYLGINDEVVFQSRQSKGR